MTEDKNYKKLGRFAGGWLVQFRYQHRTTDHLQPSWLPDEFFEMSEADQIEEIKKRKVTEYTPPNPHVIYKLAWHRLFNHEFDAIFGETPEELTQRTADKFGVFSVEWYCAQIINLIANHKGFNIYDGIRKDVHWTESIYSPDAESEDHFDDGFHAGILFSEMSWKTLHEIDAMRGAKTVESAVEGAEATAAITRERTQPRLKEMKRLVPRLGVAGAANHLAAKGMGTFTSNRGLWYRQPKK